MHPGTRKMIVSGLCVEVFGISRHLQMQQCCFALFFQDKKSPKCDLGMCNLQPNKPTFELQLHLPQLIHSYLNFPYIFFQLRDAAKNNPVVFIPSHRSYMDFLLVSYICFTMDIPLPFIAAAADFMNMRVIQTLFRNSGAFFMRRSFMSDPLYWVVFTEYIQNQLQNGDQPLEFFLEGTRSRTGKFLQPKLGRCQFHYLYERQSTKCIICSFIILPCKVVVLSSY